MMLFVCKTFILEVKKYGTADVAVFSVGTSTV